jgi:hypothetical protein
MGGFFDNTPAHAVALLVLIGRLGDVGSTLFASPTLALEANSLMRRLGWRAASISVLFCVVPYLHIGMGIAVAVASLLVSGSNLTRAWVMRGLGEQRYVAMLEMAAGGVPERTATRVTILGAAFFGLAAGTLLFVAGGPGKPAHWFAIGMFAYTLAVGFHGVSFVRRTYRTRARAPQEEGAR